MECSKRSKEKNWIVTSQFHQYYVRFLPARPKLFSFRSSLPGGLRVFSRRQTSRWKKLVPGFRARGGQAASFAANRVEQCEHNVWNTLNKKRAGGWDEQRSPPANTCQPTKCFFTVISNSVPSTSCLSKDPLYPHKYNRGRVKLSQMNTKY